MSAIIQERFSIGSTASQSFSWYKQHQLSSIDGIPTDIVHPIQSISDCLSADVSELQLVLLLHFKVNKKD